MILSGRSENKKSLFAPGCALMLYKPYLAHKIHQLLNENFGEIDMLMTCCQHDPFLTAGSKIINICPGCDKRFRRESTCCDDGFFGEIPTDQVTVPKMYDPDEWHKELRAYIEELTTKYT